MFQDLIDDTPMSPTDVSEHCPMTSGAVEALLTEAGCEPCGRSGRLRLYRADDILRHVFHIDPASLRAGRGRQSAEPSDAA